MSTFECKVVPITIEEHPNADAIELARVGDYMSIVKKGEFKTGDLGVYIPEFAVLPEWVLRRLGFWKEDEEVGTLAGNQGNRVKAIRLRGIMSQGIIFPVEFRKDVMETNTGTEYGKKSDIYVITLEEGGAGIRVEEGDDVAEFLGITKYEPVIPTSMNGEVFNAVGMTVRFDIENIKKFPDVFEEGEEVTFTEKLHGTWCCFGYHPDSDIPIVTSKGLSSNGLAFKFNEANERNLYVRMFNALTVFDNYENTISILERFCQANDYGSMKGWMDCSNAPFYILGEVFGAGVQDLTYGNLKTQFRVFDIYVGEPGKGIYMNTNRVEDVCRDMGIETVPYLYKGPFSKEVLAEYTDGAETASGTGAHMREGVVIRPTKERRHTEIGRVILKSVSDKYILRKNATEYA